MQIAYFDCFAGASGDMILGALIDAGLNSDDLIRELAKLNLSHYKLLPQKVLQHGIAGTRVHIEVDQDHHDRHPRHLQDIQKIIAESNLAEHIKAQSLVIFTRLAQAEATVHMADIQGIHFHEVGAVDAILDVVGAVSGLTLLGVQKVYCSALHVGSGTVQCQHGILPVPAPATAELIKGKPMYSTGVAGELLTPTGAAILTTLAGFEKLPPLTLERTGYGAGNLNLPIPNLLRVFIGNSSNAAHEHDEHTEGYETEVVGAIETGIDDMNPQIYDHLIDRMLDRGALDIILKPVQMKKNRPAILLTVICPVHKVNEFADSIMRETTTIGLRWRLENRIKAHRRIIDVQTLYGVIRCKVAAMGEEIINISPEYEDCRQAALKEKMPLKQVMEAAKSACATALSSSKLL
jgi:pyridinium-3,5-bisthiocarboxylic acid mononucleotide nickel chelatase